MTLLFRRTPELQREGVRNPREVAIGRQEREPVTSAQRSEQRVDGVNLVAPLSTGIADTSRLDMVIERGLEKR